MSYKIVDQITKSPLPPALKRVLVAYATFANRDGTSIRPTEDKVAFRASASRSTVSRHTQTLVELGLLVHARDEHGIFLKHAYGESGVWAYMYHIDPSKLSDPVLLEQWETQKNKISEKRKSAGAKNTTTKWVKGASGNPNGQSRLLLLEQSKLLQSPPQQIATNPLEQIAVEGAEQFATQTLPYYPRSADPNDYPSAPSGAVSQNPVSKLVSEGSVEFASLIQRIETSHAKIKETTLTRTDIGKEEKDKLLAEIELHNKIRLEHLWMSAEDLYHDLFPSKRWTDEDVEMLILLADEVGGIRGITHGGETIKRAWQWNQIHKNGKLRLFSLAELVKALRSASDRNLLAQMDAHEGCKLCMDKCPVCEGYTDCPCRAAKG